MKKEYAVCIETVERDNSEKKGKCSQTTWFVEQQAALAISG